MTIAIFRCDVCNSEYTDRVVRDWGRSPVGRSSSQGLPDEPYERPKHEECPFCRGEAACMHCDRKAVMALHWESDPLELCITCAAFELVQSDVPPLTIRFPLTWDADGKGRTDVHPDEVRDAPAIVPEGKSCTHS